jgi:non-ribosomal peptide synthetase component F/thioesterase domain-containing protein/acyl carrier protein
MKTLEQEALDLKLPEAKPLDALLSELRHLGIQLWVEGDRLRYKAAKDALTPELLAQLRDRKAEILEFLQAASLAADPSAATIPVISRDGNLPLSISQERLWYHHQFEPNSSLNNIITAYRIKGTLDLELLNRAQHEVAQRHEILRTTFPTMDGAPTVAIALEWSLSIPIENLQSIPVTERDEEAHRRAIAESRRSYDLETGPLFRMRLLQLESDSYLWVLTMHRMMADGVSVDIVFREIVTRYEAYLLGKPVVLPELPIQYLDFAHWQRQRLQGEFLDRNMHYWKEHLKAPLPILDFPLSRPRPSTQSFNTLRRRLIFPKRLNDALNTLSQKEEATLFMTLMAALKVLLYRYCDQEDVMICCSNAGRNRSEIEHLIGPFFNTLVLRTDLGGNPTFRDVIQREKKVALGAFAHQELPFEQLVPELDTSNNRGRSSLFQVFFALNPSWKDGNTLSTVELPGITFDTMFGYLYTGKTKFDLFLVGREAEEGLQFLFEYNSDLFDGEVILPFMDHFQTLIERIVTNPDERISCLSLLRSGETQQLLEKLSLPQSDITALPSVHQLIEAQVEKTPDAIAILTPHKQLTYRQLNDRSNQLAYYLRSQQLNLQKPIALYLEPSIEQLIAMLGVLKAGGFYFVLNPSDAQKHQQVLLEQANPSLILTQSHQKALLPLHHASAILLDAEADQILQSPVQNLAHSTTSQSLATVVYTLDAHEQWQSISLTNQTLVNHSADLADVYELKAGDRIFHAFNHAISENFFPSLLKGSTTVLAEDMRTSSGELFLQAIGQMSPTVMRLSTALWQDVLNIMRSSNQSLPHDLRLVVLGGKKIPLATYLSWQKQVCDYPRILNTHSVAGNNFIATTFDFATAEKHSCELPEIPIGHALPHTPIHILDCEQQPVPIGVVGEIYIGGIGGAFVSPGDKLALPLYKAGDIARHYPNGVMQWLGNIHQQDTLEEVSTLSEPNIYVASRDDIEQNLTDIWEDLLGIHPIGVQDNFFSLGGHSLLAVRLFTQIEQKLGKILPLSTLLQAPTIELLASALRQDVASVSWSPLVEIQKGGNKPPLFCMHGGGFNVLIYRDLALGLGPDQPVYGLQARGLREGETIADCMEEMASDYIQEIRRIQPNGPYYLAGLSNGGDISLEMAQQLTAQGEKVAFLGMFDSYGPEGINLLPSRSRFVSAFCYLIRYSVPSYIDRGLKFESKISLSNFLRLLKNRNLDNHSFNDTSVSDVTHGLDNSHSSQPSARSFKDWMDLGSQYVLEHSPWAFLSPKGQLQGIDGSLSDRLRELEERYEKIHSSYVLKPYVGKITLFRAQECPPGFKRDFYLGWQAIAAEGVEVYKIPGHHTSLMQSPVLAAKMIICLKKLSVTNEPSSRSMSASLSNS